MLTSVQADPMSPASEINEHIAVRRRLASFELELIARSRDLVAASKAFQSLAQRPFLVRRRILRGQRILFPMKGVNLAGLPLAL